MNIPARLDFTETVFQGSTFYESFEYTDEAGEPINLYGYTGKMQVRANPDKKILATFTTDNASMVLQRTEAQAGTVDATATAIITGTGTDFTLLNVGEYVQFTSAPTKFYKIIAINSAIEIEIDAAVTIAGDTFSKTHAGRIELRHESAITEKWNAGKYKYDLELTIGIETFKLLLGLFIVNGDITK